MRIYVALVFLLSALAVKAQDKKKSDSVNRAYLIGAHYSLNWPGADLADRYGIHSTLGASFSVKTKKNWIFGAEYHYIFGDQVHENTLDSIRADIGYLINGSGQLQDLRVQQRGHMPLLTAGKVFPIGHRNYNSGFTAKVGAGYMIHKIHYYAPGGLPPQLNGNYVKGYDRLTAGPVLMQSVGYLYLSPQNYLSFSLEFQVAEGFTKSQRDWNFDTRMKDTRNRMDLMYGFRANIYIPIQRKGRVTNDGYYY